METGIDQRLDSPGARDGGVMSGEEIREGGGERRIIFSQAAFSFEAARQCLRGAVWRENNQV